MSHHIVTITAPAAFLRTNRRDHFHQTAILTRTWRDAAHWAAKAQRVPAFGVGPVEVVATIHREDRRRFDLDGVVPTVKACIDGLRDAGVLDEDDSRVITSLTIRDGGPWADAALVLTIHEQEATA